MGRIEDFFFIILEYISLYDLIIIFVCFPLLIYINRHGNVIVGVITFFCRLKII